MEVITEMRSVLADYRGDRVLIGELYHPIENLVFYYGKQGEGVHLPFNFNLMWVDWKARSVMDLVSRFEGLLPEGAWPNWVLGNHDQPRVATRLGAEQARLAMMLILTLRGTPTLYQGEELGLENADIPADEIQDLFAKAGKGQGRDGERTPMPWDQSLHFGFSTHKPWLRLGADSARRTVAVQEQDRKQRLKGLDAQKANIAAAKAVSRILRSSLGPKGMDKMLQSPDGDVTISTCLDGPNVGP